MAQPPYDNRTDAEKAKAIAEQGLPGQEWTGFQQDRMGPMPAPQVNPQAPNADGLYGAISGAEIGMYANPRQQPTMQQPAPPVDPGSMVQGQQQSFDRQTGGGLSVDVQAPGHRARFGQGEFYSGPERPFETRSTQVGRYGGAPIVLPYTGQAPMSVLAERQAQINRDKAALEQQKQQWDPYADLKEVIPPAYQKSFQRAAYGTLEKQIEDTVSMFDGDEMAAYQAIQDPMSPEGRAWKRTVSDINSTTDMVNSNYGRAVAYVEGVKGGAVTEDPELLKRAENFLDGLESFDMDWAKAGERAEAYDMMQSFDSYVKQYDVEGRLRKAFAETPGEPEVTRQNGLYIVTIQQKRDFESAVDAEAEHIAKIYNGRGGMTKAVIRDYLMRKFPMQVEQKVQAIKPNAPKGGGKGGADGQKYSAHATSVPHGPGERLPAIIPTQTVAGKERRLDKTRLFDFDGNESDLYGAYFRYNAQRNGWDWVGASLSETEYEKARDEVRAQGYQQSSEEFDTKLNEIISKKGRTRNFKAEDNQVANRIHLGYDSPSEYVANLIGSTASEVDELLKDPKYRPLIMQEIQAAQR